MTWRNKRLARKQIKRCATALLAHPSSVHYTQGADRWDGIAHHKAPGKPGLLPFRGDCSSTATWILWRALHVLAGQADRVNGTDWKAGYTGTLAQHGKRVSGRPGTRRVGDLVLYGRGWPFEHVAIIVGPGVVFSHGSESGPFLLPIHYRPDAAEFRRYF
jgi:hypothetical protein